MSDPAPSNDLETEVDLFSLMQAFYADAMIDPVLAPKFEELDLDAHIPVIVEFWKGVIIGGSNYRGSPLAVHVPLALLAEHFEAWVPLFHRTIDARFQGANAETLKSRAVTIAQVFRHQLGID